MTAADRIRIRLTEAQACRAAVTGPCAALSERVETWRAALEEALAADPAAPRQECRATVVAAPSPAPMPALAAEAAPLPADDAEAPPAADTAAVIQQHQSATDQDGLPDPPAIPAPREWPPHPMRTRERMAAFPALWCSRAATIAVRAALEALPGKPMTRKDTIYDIARAWGLPTSRTWTIAAAQAPGPVAPPPPTASTQRTPDRMKLFRTLWPDARLTVPQVQARLNELPGKPIAAPQSLYGWARIAGLPTQRPTPEEAPPAPLPDLPLPPPPRVVAPALPAPPPAPAAPRRQDALPAPPTSPELCATEAALTPSQREAVRRLRGQAHDVEAIAKRTDVALELVRALDAQAEAAALDLLAGGVTDTDTIALEAGLPPARVRTLRDRARQRAA